ncbi:MAG: hypothetical protein CL862_00540 [Cyanobium sp. NAT70]|nr:hypothetical protein [Cyanobium sp. NAT70]|tara:strand:+ start:1254 stop:2633 length:1380 start_codon:yes stop_codon:yes gene_type:complete
MQYQNPVDVPSSGNVWIDGLTDGYRWGTNPGDRQVGYTFISDTREKPGGEFGGYPSWGWSEQERKLMEGSLNTISDVCTLKFVDRGDDNDDEVEIWFYNLDSRSSEDSYGFAYTPGSDPDEGLVAVNWSTYQNNDGTFKHSIAPGSFYGITFLHELCHALGLKHPHDRGLNGQPRFPGLNRGSNEFKDAGDYGQNSHPWTQLSYVDKGSRNGLVPNKAASYGFLQTLGALDTAAMQWLYGINSKTALGDDVYHLPTKNEEGTGWRCIWDAGGTDLIDGSKARKPVTIDLRNATLDFSDHAGGYVSRVEGIFGGLTIAHDWDGENEGDAAGICIIENAIGGRKADVLIGNAADNVLKGGRGDDVIYPREGSGNVAKGGKGRDQFWIQSEDDSHVTIKDFSKRHDRLVFDGDRSKLTMRTRQGSTDLIIGGDKVAKVNNVTGLSLESHFSFDGFDSLSDLI